MKYLLAIVGLLFAFSASPVFAGSPHFVGAPVFTTSGNTLTATGKIAGLGNEDQVHVVLTADAACINGGGNHPRAENKGATIAQGDFPVQNGMATFTLSGTAVTDPACNPPMHLVYTNVKVTDTTHGISYP